MTGERARDSSDGVTGFEIVWGGDVIRDGMYSELQSKLDDPPTKLAKVFYSDVSKRFFVTLFEPDVPIEAIERLLRHARSNLPAVQDRIKDHAP